MKKYKMPEVKIFELDFNVIATSGEIEEKSLDQDARITWC